MDCINFSFEGENLCDISWASKNFACSFCKREFRSAQALGGHMNVHRRDRARLRLLPSTFSSEICPHNPNPNPKYSYFSSSSSSSSAAKPCFPHNYSSWVSPSMRKALVVSTPSSSASISTADESYKKPKFDFPSSPQLSHAHPSFLPNNKGKIFKGFAQKDVDDDEFNKDLDLDLEMGFFKDHKEEVDLELRLGHL